LRRTSMSTDSTLCCGAHGTRKLCQYGAASGPSWRFTRTSIGGLVAATPASLAHDVVLAWPRRDPGHVAGLLAEFGTVRRPQRLGGLQEVLVVALRKRRLVVRAAAFIASEGTQGDHSRQLEHVPELLHERDLLVHPAPVIGDADAAPAVLQLEQLLV